VAGVVEACDDERLLNFPLWPRQRELLEAVEQGRRISVWALGRRSGKTTMAALVGLHDCLLRPELDGLVRPGERRYSVAVATSLRQARLFVDAARSIVEHSPLLKPFVEEVCEDVLVFRNGTGLAGFPCSSRGVRGWPISSLLLDEAAHFVSDTEGPQVAERVFSSLVPSSTQFGNRARVIVASTPFGASGFFAQLHARAASGELQDARAFRCSTQEMNPTISEAVLASERERDPESFRSEYLAEFLGGGYAFLDPERIEEAVADRGELAPEQATGWVAGLDPAFSSDPFGLALVGRERGSQRLLLGLARAWLPSRQRAESFEERRLVEDVVLAEVAAVCKSFGARVVTDQYAAPAVTDRLRREGLNVRTVPMTATSKTAAFSELRARLNVGAIELYEHPDLLAELRRLRTRYAAGSASVVNPRVGGSHGDLAQATAMAVYEHRFGAGKASFHAPSGRLDRGRLEALAAEVGIPIYGN
jgi:hypothetical protein